MKFEFWDIWSSWSTKYNVQIEYKFVLETGLTGFLVVLFSYQIRVQTTGWDSGKEKQFNGSNNLSILVCNYIALHFTSHL